MFLKAYLKICEFIKYKQNNDNKILEKRLKIQTVNNNNDNNRNCGLVGNEFDSHMVVGSNLVYKIEDVSFPIPNYVLFT